MADDKKHSVNLPVCFLLLLLFTAAEIALYEFWRHTRDAGSPFVPKYVLVLRIFLFTLPKAFIVMTYFMHLRFERSLLVLIAMVPFVMVAIAILPSLTDTRALASRNYTKAVRLADDLAPAGEHGGDAAHEEEYDDDDAYDEHDE